MMRFEAVMRRHGIWQDVIQKSNLVTPLNQEGWLGVVGA